MTTSLLAKLTRLLLELMNRENTLLQASSNTQLLLKRMKFQITARTSTIDTAAKKILLSAAESRTESLSTDHTQLTKMLRRRKSPLLLLLDIKILKALDMKSQFPRLSDKPDLFANKLLFLTLTSSFITSFLN